MEPDDELIADIAPDVLRYLERIQFFEKLDDMLSPPEPLAQVQLCDGSYRLAESVLLEAGTDRSDLADVFGVLRSKGACCDCEVLYNMAQSSRFREKYWREQYEKQRRHGQPPTN